MTEKMTMNTAETAEEMKKTVEVGGDTLASAADTYMIKGTNLSVEKVSHAAAIEAKTAEVKKGFFAKLGDKLNNAFMDDTEKRIAEKKRQQDEALKAMGKTREQSTADNREAINANKIAEEMAKDPVKGQKLKEFYNKNSRAQGVVYNDQTGEWENKSVFGTTVGSSAEQQIAK